MRKLHFKNVLDRSHTQLRGEEAGTLTQEKDVCLTKQSSVDCNVSPKKKGGGGGQSPGNKYKKMHRIIFLHNRKGDISIALHTIFSIIRGRSAGVYRHMPVRTYVYRSLSRAYIPFYFS